MDFSSLIRGILGIILILGIAFLFSNNKKKVDWKLVLGGIGLHLVFAILIIKGDSLRLYF